MKIFNGKKEAQRILQDLKKKIKKRKVRPKLAVILIGDNPESKLYIKLKKRAARKIGIRVLEYRFKRGAAEKAIIAKIKELNNDKSVNGILVQLPLPEKFNTKHIMRVISPQKNVDREVLASAILLVLKKAKVKKRILAIVNSEFFGRTLKNFLKTKGFKINYILSKNFSSQKVKSANVIITACGCPGLIKGDIIKDSTVLIDAGITKVDKKVVGDVDKKSVSKKAAFLTPVPGGIGPLVVALLLKNVYEFRKIY